MQEALAGREHILSIAQIGTILRLLSDDSDNVDAAIRQRLNDLGLSFELREVGPNLEDVFVAATLDRRESKAAA